jgi:hypothetical protein
VGSYPIEVSGLSSTNYAITFSNGTLRVSAYALVVSADSQSRTYGAANPALTGTLVGLQSGDNITASYSTAADTNSPAGAYDIVPVLSDPDSRLSNYSVTTNRGTLTVSPAALSVTADDASRAYGQANPGFNATFSGFVNGEHTNVLAGALVLSTVANTNSPVGVYPIEAGGVSSTNYAITFSNGKLTVTNGIPVITPIATQLVNEGSTLSLAVSATDPSVPPLALLFSLAAGAPEGASLNTNTGAFIWTPPITGISSTNAISVRVSNNAQPPQIAVATFNAVVVARPRLISMDEANGAIGVTWSVLPGLIYQPQYKDNLSDMTWVNLGEALVAANPAMSVTNNGGASLERFYRLLQITNP